MVSENPHAHISNIQQLYGGIKSAITLSSKRVFQTLGYSEIRKKLSQILECCILDDEKNAIEAVELQDEDGNEHKPPYIYELSIVEFDTFLRIMFTQKGELSLQDNEIIEKFFSIIFTIPRYRDFKNDLFNYLASDFLRLCECGDSEPALKRINFLFNIISNTQLRDNIKILFFNTINGTDLSDAIKSESMGFLMPGLLPHKPTL